MKLKVIDLFCGCGGFSTGFKQAGHDIILAIDLWEIALKSHEQNHPETNHWLKDIRDINKLPNCDIIIGSPPCQNFSNGNAKRNCSLGLELVHEFERIIKINNPKYWLWENVKPVKEFYPYATILNSFDFGLDQNRQRAFISNFNLTNRNPIIKGNLTPLYGYNGALDTNNGKCTLLHRGHSRTITTHRIRDMETKELLPINKVKLLMGFPSDYKLCGGISIQQKQLGNSVCPPVAKAFGDHLMKNDPKTHDEVFKEWL